MDVAVFLKLYLWMLKFEFHVVFFHHEICFKVFFNLYFKCKTMPN